MMRLLKDVLIVSMDEERRVIKDGSLVLNKDRIEWLGHSMDIPDIYRSIEPILLPGRVLFPGFVNIHTHAALSVLRGIGDDLGVAPAYSSKLPQGSYLSAEDCYTFSLLGGLEALKFGTTCIVDNYINAHESAKAFDLLGMRAVVSERLHDADLLLIPENRYEFDPALGDQLLTSNMDLIERWDGVSDRRIQARFGPHAPDTCSTRYLEQIRDAADNTGKGMVIHLSQSRREVEQIDARSSQPVAHYLESVGILGKSLIAGHCIFVTDEEKQLLGETNTQIAHLSGSNAKGGMMAPIKDLLTLGLNIGLGTDNMAGDMVEVMRLALCTARMRQQDNQALRAVDVLEMATIGGAKALGMEAEIGSLEVGKKADLVVVNYNQAHLAPLVDPIANLIHNGLGSDIEMVFVDGEILISGGSSTRVEEDQLLSEAQNRSEALWIKLS
jgi:5-methylthioadenosine/S-adenosylhomocysteine deaminase